jgi:hypothetical protein
MKSMKFTALILSRYLSNSNFRQCNGPVLTGLFLNQEHGSQQDYIGCKPLKSTIDKGDVIINKSGDRCPTGFYRSGNYCNSSGGSDKHVITREPGEKCPTGWYKANGYCMKY